MSGTIGVIANDNARYTLFASSLIHLQHPVNSVVDFSITSDRIYGRNKLTERALERGAEWLMFIDDDHVFPTNILTRLLARELPIVGSLYLQRMQPFMPLAYSARLPDGYQPLDLTAHGPDELVEVAALGTGGMLIRSEVFHKLDFPWFEHGVASEDLIFCDKARAYGFPVHVDLGVRLGHMMPSAVWPSHGDMGDGSEGWQVGFSLSDGYSLAVPLAPPELLHEPSADSPSRSS
jgi:hypothetical protein